MTSDDAAKGGGQTQTQSENKAEAEKGDKSEMPPNEATPAPAAAASAEAPEANGGKDVPSNDAAANADVEAGKILEQDGVGKVEFTASKAEDGKKVYINDQS